MVCGRLFQTKSKEVCNLIPRKSLAVDQSSYVPNIASTAAREVEG